MSCVFISDRLRVHLTLSQPFSFPLSLDVGPSGRSSLPSAAVQMDYSCSSQSEGRAEWRSYVTTQVKYAYECVATFVSC